MSLHLKRSPPLVFSLFLYFLDIFSFSILLDLPTVDSKKEEDKDKIKTKVPKNNDKVIYLGYYMKYNGHSMFVLNVEEDKEIQDKK